MLLVQTEIMLSKYSIQPKSTIQSKPGIRQNMTQTQPSLESECDICFETKKLHRVGTCMHSACSNCLISLKSCHMCRGPILVTFSGLKNSHSDDPAFTSLHPIIQNLILELIKLDTYWNTEYSRLSLPSPSTDLQRTQFHKQGRKDALENKCKEVYNEHGHIICKELEDIFIRQKTIHAKYEFSCNHRDDSYTCGHCKYNCDYVYTYLYDYCCKNLEWVNAKPGWTYRNCNTNINLTIMKTFVKWKGLSI